jgi:hypothetical protein
MNDQTTLHYKWSNKVTYGFLRKPRCSWMIPAEACPGTFVTLKGACGKTTTTQILIAHQKEGIDLTKKTTTSSQKRILYIFFAVDHPLCDV